jgi:serine/threonine protein kinase
MELNSASIHDVIHPTAAFSQQRSPLAEAQTVAFSDTSWDESQLNPKNRIDSLDPLPNPLWRIDGCTGLGTQYYVVPLFLGDIPPTRFDVFIPDEAVVTPILRELLDLNIAFHTKDAPRLRRLGISRYIVRALQAWITTMGHDAYSDLCDTLPFGSRIIFESLHVDVRKTRISVVPTYYVERELLGVAKLDEILGLAPELLPKAVELSRLSIVQELHDSVCLVRMLDDGEDETGQLWILKALSSSTKYLFVELRNLLRMGPHPNIISRPEYLIIKRCLFGGKTAVVGFLLPFHRHGTVRDILPFLRVHGRLRLRDQTKWAIQLASAVSHIRERGRMFYPDLRLDNILFSASHDIIMVDFEQRGVWCEFAAPEVNAIEYVRILASDELDEANFSIPEDVRTHFAGILHRLLPDWDVLQACEGYSSPRPRGYANYNVAWLALDETEQEAAMVYMLGRVLWCIFEGQSAPQKAAVWQSYRYEPDIEFPDFRMTPYGLRDLIDRCTRGRRDVLSSLIVRERSRLVLRDNNSSNAEEVLRVAQEWWKAEVKAAEEFLELREARKAAKQWNSNHFGRPKLREVLAELERFRDLAGLDTVPPSLSINIHYRV